MTYKGWFYFVPVYLHDTYTIQAFTVTPRNRLLLPALRLAMLFHRMKGDAAVYPINVTG